MDLTPEMIADAAAKAGATAGKQAVDAALETNSFVKREELPKPMETNGFATKEDVQSLQTLIETNNQPSVPKVSITTFAQAFDVFEVNSLLKANGGTANSELVFEVNAASTYTGSAGADSAPGREDRQTEIEYDPHQHSIVMEFMQRTGSGAAYRLNTATSTTGAAGKTQGSAFGRTTKSVVDEYVQYITVGHVLTVPQEDLNDVTQLDAYFNEELKEEIIDVLNSQSLTGDGTAGNIRGLESWSAVKTQVTFETLYGDLSDTYAAAANRIDVIVATVAALEQDNFDSRSGSFKVFVRPTFMAQIRGIKSTTGEYVLRTAWSPESNMMKDYLGSCEIITTSAVAADTFHLFHTSSVKWVVREGMTTAVGYDTDDWSRNNVSLKAYGRYALVSGKPNGIVNGTFANAILALNA